MPGQVKARADILAIAAGVEEYSRRNAGQLPPSLGSLTRAGTAVPAILCVDRMPSDPWGREYHYEAWAARPGFRVFSLGADGRPGGKGDDRDVDNLTFPDQP